MTYRPVLAVGFTALFVLSACGGKDATPNAPAPAGVAITATDNACQVAKTTFDPGPVTFTVTNNGQQITEVYVYGDNGGAFTKVISEVENIGPGLSRELNATLTSGRYEIACKPGQTGNGIRTPITVTGSSASSPAIPSAQTKYDREIEIEVNGTKVEGADGLTGKLGERIEFKLENKGKGERELEIIDPTGKIVEEVEAKAGGAEETIVQFSQPGAWTLKIEGGGFAETEKKITVS